MIRRDNNPINLNYLKTLHNNPKPKTIWKQIIDIKDTIKRKWKELTWVSWN